MFEQRGTDKTKQRETKLPGPGCLYQRRSIWICNEYLGGVLSGEAVVSGTRAVHLLLGGDVKDGALDGDVDGEVGVGSVVLGEFVVGEGAGHFECFGSGWMNERGKDEEGSRNGKKKKGKNGREKRVQRNTRSAVSVRCTHARLKSDKVTSHTYRTYTCAIERDQERRGRHFAQAQGGEAGLLIAFFRKCREKSETDDLR